LTEKQKKQSDRKNKMSFKTGRPKKEKSKKSALLFRSKIEKSLSGNERKIKNPVPFFHRRNRITQRKRKGAEKFFESSALLF